MCAFIAVFLDVTDCQESAPRAHVDPEQVWHQEQSFTKEVTNSMRDYTVSFHLSKTKSTCPASAMSRLPSDCDYRPTWTSIHFVIDKMPQSLVVDRTNEYQILQSLTWIRIHHKLVPITLVSRLMQLFCLNLHAEVPERCRVLREPASNNSHFSN